MAITNVTEDKQPIKQNQEEHFEECSHCGAILQDGMCLTEGCPNNIKEQEEKQQEEQVKQQSDIVADTFYACKNRPTDEQLELLKEQYGELHYLVKDEENIYIFRSLKRGEFKQIKQIKALTEEKFEEMIVEKCLVFPANVISLMTWNAGLVSSLAQAIMNASNFYSQEEVNLLTRKL